MARIPHSQRVAASRTRGASSQPPKMGFSDEEASELSRSLQLWIGSRVVWTLFPRARAIWIRGTDRVRDVAQLTRKLSKTSGGGLVFWLKDEETDELLKLSKKFSLRAPSLKASRKGNRHAIDLPPAEAIEAQWNDQPVRVIVLGQTKAFARKLSDLMPGMVHPAEPPAIKGPAQIVPLQGQKVDRSSDIGVQSGKPRQSERNIGDSTSFSTGQKGSLPDEPAKLWAGGFRGRPRSETTKALLAFLREVYGPYMQDHRDGLRAYIWRKDAKLYQAILDYERHSELPMDIKIPTRPEKVESRLHEAFRRGLEGLDKPARRSVTGRLRRMSKEKRNPEF